MSDGPDSRAFLDIQSKDEIYRVTGEPFRYLRILDRKNDVYHKTYTNLTTGEVAVDETEPLTAHTGRGAARRKPGADATSDEPPAADTPLSGKG